jgi:hypothetical protein
MIMNSSSPVFIRVTLSITSASAESIGLGLIRQYRPNSTSALWSWFSGTICLFAVHTQIAMSDYRQVTLIIHNQDLPVVAS